MPEPLRQMEDIVPYLVEVLNAHRRDTSMGLSELKRNQEQQQSLLRINDQELREDIRQILQ
jgi:predicted ribonuclease toxin of YeeF-YezG toxin-antitoxin module